MAGRYLGVVVGGSISQGIEVKLEGDASVEEVKVGAPVTIHGERHRFFGLVTDVALEATDPHVKSAPPNGEDSFITRVMAGTAAYGTAQVQPHLVLPLVAGLSGSPQPAKAVPAFFSRVHYASPADVALVFGEEDDRHFAIGSPLDLEAKVCLDLAMYVARSNGIFGKSGTGKSFLARLLLVGLLQKNLASALVFDMASEYGWQGTSERGSGYVKGLKQLFPSRVSIFTLDPDHAQRRQAPVDYTVQIGYEHVEPEDIGLLRQTLNLSDAAADAANPLQRHFGQAWLRSFLRLKGPDIRSLADDLNLNQQALAALHRRLERLERYAFLVDSPAGDPVAAILQSLARGDHVVLEFGKHKDDLTAYMLVANLLSRRIHQRYVQQKEAALGDRAREPRPLVIVIEEAHKFLDPQVASQTIFGTIAREMRKYNVTLLVVDQRPSGIDTEVMSQVGTRIALGLDDDRDVDAVLAGVRGGRELRSALARLEPQQQALVFGHAVPMPIVVKVREYGDATYAELGRRGRRRASEGKQGAEDDLFG
ncbi:MAG: DUF87 domain-containing protein [Chloroflexi bacterium]|nr:DUF87 domain-containing protein [Chloroflexota bacterium]